ncbi:MAG: hypothetical protein U9N31_10295, partial [Candidatus Marinimicrobia bacterium]|nr:hypothetical protein [Candidatus Neomarinimicrobiota bacterium]
VLDSLFVVKKDTVNQKQSTNQLINQSTLSAEALAQAGNQPKSYPINASGTFFRGIEMSSQGVGGLSGGLRFQLAGKLSENIRVSGTVTDESIPIQPDGTTAALDELDKVYLNVSHPSGELTAGDLTVNNKSGKYNNNNRNIVGIKNSINRDDVKIRTIIGQSKGKYHRLEMKGADGRQGPYFLTSKEGLRNVIISAGSETVWLNGEKLSRGEDRDYIIDYSTGELTFTPKHLIYFDLDIDIEYQYSDNAYKSNYVEAGLEGVFGEKGQYSISYIDERENAKGSFLSAEQRTTFKSNDVVYQSGVVQDSLGDYVLINGVFLFMHAAYNVLPEDRYTVTFSPDPTGEYVRKISDKNRIYYEFVYTDDIDDRQRYSPGRSLRAPVSHQLIQFDTNLKLRPGLSLSTEGAFSIRENNLFSNRFETSLNGNAFRLGLDQKPINFGKMNLGFDFEYWRNSPEFRSLSRERGVDFNESWDLNNEQEENGESMSSLRTEIAIGKGLKSGINLSRLVQGDRKKDRTEIDLNYKGSLINGAQMHWNKVQSETAFQQVYGQIRLFNGPLKPFIIIAHEVREKVYQFDDILVGLDFARNNRSFSLGIGQREDQSASFSDPTTMETTQTGKIIQVDYKSRQKTGWRQEWMYRQRIQENEKSQSKNDYNTFRTALNFRNRKSPFQLDIVLNSQTSMSEARAVVYDSIGVGLGHYRYDDQLNEYISDPNGAYVAHTVFTGDRKHGSRLDGITRISIDFAKWKFDRLKNWKYRFLNRVDFHGSKFSITGPQVDVGEVYRSNYRHGLIYKKRGKKDRYRIWNQKSFNLNGLDPRGWEYRYKQEWGGESQIALKGNYHLVFEGDTHESRLESERERITKRSVDGYAFEFGLKNYSSTSFQWESRFIYYWDHAGIGGIRTPISGLNMEKVWAQGVKMNWIQFIGKDGRIEGNFEYYIVNGFKSMPPEALKGLSYGRTLRSNIRASFFLGKSLSVNATLLYLDDARYDGFVKLQGEVRAHF